jgi:hypothetical protein
MTTTTTTAALAPHRAQPCHESSRRLAEDAHAGARFVALTLLASALTSATLVIAAVSWVVG